MQLLQRSAPQPSEGAADKARRLRNQLWTLLLDRMGRVRSVARHVFRSHPEIARKATSAYERRRRAESRRRQAEARAAEETPVSNGRG